MNISTAFKPFEADYTASYGVYLSPVGAGKKAPVAVEQHGLFTINNPQTWLTLEAAEAHRKKLEALPEIAANFKAVIARAMRPYEVCLDFDPETDEQHTEAATWAMSFKDARIERTVNGGYHVNFTYSYPGMFPGKITTPNGLKIDIKRGYYPASVDEFAGGSALTIGECVNDREDVTDLTERDYKTLQALLFICGKSDIQTAATAGGFKSGSTPTPQEDVQHSSAQAELDRIEIERPNLFAALQQPPDEPSTAPGFAGVTGSDKLARVIAEVYEVTGSEQNTLDIVRGSPVGWFDNRSSGKKSTYTDPDAYQRFLAKDVRRVINKKQQHNAAQTAGVTMSLENVVTLKPAKKTITSKPRRLSYSSFTGEPGISDTTTIIVEGLLTAGVCYLYGASKSYKSFFAVGLCGAITKKTDYFNGRRIAGGNALYIAAEAPKTLTARRFAWAQEHNNGQPLPHWHTIEGGLNFADPELFAELVELCDEITTDTGEPLRLIVVDTFSRTFVGNENSTEDAMKFHNAVDVLAQRYSCAVVVVHHSGKDEARGMRGSSAMYAAADTVIICKRGNGLSIELELDKTKVGADGERIALPLKLVTLPESFATANRSSQQFTTIPDPQREEQRLSEELTTLVLMDNEDANKPATAAEIALAMVTKKSNPEIVIDVLRQHCATDPNDPERPAVTLEGLRALIAEYITEKGLPPNKLTDIESDTLKATVSRMVSREIVLKEIKKGVVTFYPKSAEYNR
ncbi:AAA family ATPase [Salmonella enterica subsp. enterica serovar Braenderup]|nr:AAA family ATPase [Salmonella enterica subsp. enterica serovar Braenderup]